MWVVSYSSMQENCFFEIFKKKTFDNFQKIIRDAAIKRFFFSVIIKKKVYLEKPFWNFEKGFYFAANFKVE